MAGCGKLAGKVALVTGSGRGMGAAFAKALAAEGAGVILNYAKARERAEAVQKEIEKAGGRAIIVQADVTREEDITRLAAEGIKAFGKIDILVNNAAMPPIWNDFMKTSWDDVMKEVDISTKGTFLCSKAVLPGMMERKWGRIINMGGSALTQPALRVYGYWMCKAAVLGMTKTMALEVGPYNITVNMVLPGQIETEFHEHWGPPETGGKTPLNVRLMVANERQVIHRLGQPEDVASAVVYFASEESSFITGQAIHISAGMHVSPV